MHDRNLSIRKIVSYLNDSEFEGGGLTQILLKSVKDISPDSGKRNILHDRSEHRDQIANYMLLTANKNSLNGKCDIPLDDRFDRSIFKSDEEHEGYLAMLLTPQDQGLWKLENYEAFIEARKQLTPDNLSYMLRTAQGDHV